MSEATPEAPQGEPAAEATPAPKPAGDVPPEVKRALRDANKEAETLRLKLKEFEDRDKTDQQKLAEQNESLARQNAELASRSLRLEVAFEKGLTPAQAKRLVGATREELEADADELLETFKPAEPARPSLDLGPRPTATPAPLTDGSPRSLIAAGIASSDATKRK